MIAKKRTPARSSAIMQQCALEFYTPQTPDRAPIVVTRGQDRKIIRKQTAITLRYFQIQQGV